MSNKLTEEQSADILTLVSPYLENTSIDDVNYQENCGCYSEWTTESTHFSIVFKASKYYDDKKIQSTIRILENVVRQWAQSTFDWTGCECCCNEDEENELGYCSVRIIPFKE